MESVIKKAQTNKEIMVLDIEKAYGMLWKEGLIKLDKLWKLWNWTLKGNVCSPVLFSIIINDRVEQVEYAIRKSLYDDGTSNMQSAIGKVEEWTHKWGFKSQVKCLRHHKTSVLVWTGAWTDQRSKISLHLMRSLDDLF